VSSRNQHHPRDPRGVASGGGAHGLSGGAAGGVRRLIIRTDGAARGNPGPASAGAALIDADRPGAERPGAAPIATISEALGHQTNNVAEWTAVVRALDLAAELGAEEVQLLLDSKLVVEQIRGRWRVKDAKLAPLHDEAIAGLRRFRRWSARHVPRSENATADGLANEALDRVAAGGPALVVRRPPAGPGGAGFAVTQLGMDLENGGTRDGTGRGPVRPIALEAGFDPGDPGPDPGRLIVRILGSGTSQGIPRIACACPVCTSADPRDRRYRASALLSFGEMRVLLDCGPDIKWQAIAAGMRRLDAVLLTHDHQDAIGGLDELRRFNELRGGYLPVHAPPEDLAVIVSRFAYAFRPDQPAFFGIPQLRPFPLDGPFMVGGRRFIPVPVIHVDRAITGYRTGGFAYCSDVQRIEPEGLALLRDLDVLVISALRDQPHPTHQTVAEALEVIASLRPRRAFLTHLDHELGHAALAARLPAGVEVAWDGLELELP
jgi:phosphoribosyl 1,2-cyclic phosphate phosphodiesterase